jgi:SAM-dependent methyltransferase
VAWDGEHREVLSAGDREYWEERARRHGAAACGCLNPVEYRYEERLRWDAFRRLVKLQRGWEVLDVGCGTGTWSRRIAAMGATVVGADFSSEMVRMATPAPGVEFMVGSAQDLALADGRFDLVVSVTVLQHITSDPELERALANLHRMLKPGARFFLLEYSPVGARAQPAGAGHMRYRTVDDWTMLCGRAGFELAKLTGVRFIGHRVLGGGVARWRRLRRRAPENPELDLAETALRGMAGTIDLISARIPGTSSIADLHAFLFMRMT